MFSLIITIISIALVAALALATLYYGGTAFSQSTAKAEAARSLNEGQQLMAAADLFLVNRGRYPANVAELVASDYLKQIPRAQSGVGSVFADTAEWEMPEPEVPVFAKTTADKEVCRSVNQTAYGMDGILMEPRAGLISQCWGQESTELSIVYAKGIAAMQQVVVYQPVLNTQPAPTSPEGEEWLEPPNGAEPSAPPMLVFSPASRDFGTVQVGEASATGAFTLQNGGGSRANNLAVAAPAGFEIVTNDCPAALLIGQQCNVGVRFAPSAAQTYSSSVLEARADNGTGTAMLSGVGQAPQADLTSAFFPATQQGGSSIAQAVLTNSGVGSLTVFPVNASSVTGLDFAFEETTCTSSLSSGESCTVTVRFSPTAAQNRSGVLRLSTSAGERVSALSASGIRAELVFNPASLPAYGDTTVGTSVTSATLTLTNQGQAGAQTLGLSTPAGFEVVDTTCPVGATLASGQDCTLAVRFTPNDYQSYGGDLIASTTTGQGATLPLSGRGFGSAASLESGSLNVSFPDTAFGGTATQVLSFRNQGNAPLNLTVQNLDAAQFAVAANTCSNVASGATCAITISMLTNAIGAKSDLSFNLAGSSTGVLSASAQGLVTGISAAFSPTSFGFGNTTVGQTSVTSVTLTNNGNITANLNPQTLVSGSGPFTFTGCTSVAPGASCTLGATFAPTAAGAFEANYRPSSANVFNSLRLTGTGVQPAPGAFALYSGAGTIRWGTADGVNITLNNPRGGTVQLYRYFTRWSPVGQTDDGFCEFNGNIGGALTGLYYNVSVNGVTVTMEQIGVSTWDGARTRYLCDYIDPRSIPASFNGTWRTWLSTTPGGVN